MRKWKQGVIAVVLFFVSVAVIGITADLEANNQSALTIVFVVIFFFSLAYAAGLVVFFVFGQFFGWSKRRFGARELGIEEKVIKTKKVAMYECGNCKMLYSDSQNCPQCGSPYRRVVEQKTEEEIMEKWKK